MYIIHWKSKVTGAIGNGTAPIEPENAARAIEVLNSIYSKLHHWLVPYYYYDPIESFKYEITRIIEKNRLELKESIDNIFIETVDKIESVENNNFTAFIDYISKSLAYACDIPEDILRNKCNELDFYEL